MMELDLLTAISPIDGRYRSKAGALAAYFSEFALIKYRVQVEIEYFITLCELPLPQLKSFDSAPVSYTHLTLPTTCRGCRSRWSPYH